MVTASTISVSVGISVSVSALAFKLIDEASRSADPISMVAVELWLKRLFASDQAMEPVEISLSRSANSAEVGRASLASIVISPPVNDELGSTCAKRLASSATLIVLDVKVMELESASEGSRW